MDWRDRLDIVCGLSWVWTYEEGGYPGLIVGFVNNETSAVPGVLRVSVVSADLKVNVGGSLDVGLPLPGRVRQAKVCLAQGREVAEITPEGGDRVKGRGYPVRWACRQKLNEDGSLTLWQTVGL